MSFDRLDYLSWYMPRLMQQRQVIHLDASGVPSLGPDEIESATGDPWTMARTFEAALATWLGLESDEVVFAPGATGGTLLALLTLAAPGTEIVVETPIYEPMLRQAERVAPVLRLVRQREEGYRLPLSAARRLIGAQTAVVMITEPHNPSGRLSPVEEVLELAAMAKEHDAILLVNEVYRGFCDAPSLHGEAPNMVVVSSLSKLTGAYWARIGWLSAPPGIAATLRSAHLNLGMANALSAAYGMGVLARVGELRDKARAMSQPGAPIVEQWLRDQPELSWHPPQGPGFGCVALPEGTNDVALAERLFEEAEVLLIPGQMFEAPGTLRISWLQAGDRLAEGLAAISAALAR